MDQLAALSPPTPAGQEQLVRRLVRPLLPAELLRVDRALELGTDLVARQPGRPTAWTALAHVYWTQEDHAAALVALERGRELANDSISWPDALVLISAHWRAGEHDQARRHYKQLGAETRREILSTDVPGFKALLTEIDDALDPDAAVAGEHQTSDTQRIRQRGQAALRLKLFDVAISHFKKLAEILPQDADAWTGVGQAQLELGRTAEAEESFGTSLEHQPDHAAALAGQTTARMRMAQQDANLWSQRAAASEQQRQYASAAEHATRAIELQPNQGRFWGQRGRARFLLGRYEESLPDFAKAVDLKSPDGADWGYLAQLHLRAEQVDDYRRVVTAMLAEFAGRKTAYDSYYIARIGLWDADSGVDPARCVDNAEFAVKSLPKTTWFLNTLALAYYRAGQHERAITRAQECLELDPNWPFGMNWLVLALAHHAQGRHAEARDFLAKSESWLAPQRARLTATPGTPPPHSHHWLEMQLLSSEARRVIGSP